MIYRIYKDCELVNTITAPAEFAAAYAEKHGYTYEEVPVPEQEPEQTPTIEARVAALEDAIASGLALYEEGLSNG